MRARRTIQIHGLRTRHWHVKRAYISLSVFEGDVAAVHAAIHGRARFVGSRLSDCVVAVGELELHNVADCRSDGVGDEGVLGPANDDGDDLAGATEGIALDMLVESVSSRVCEEVKTYS